MSKLKTKKSAAKRFSYTASGLIKRSQSGKRHGMIKKSSKQNRNLRRGTLVSKVDEKVIKQYFLPRF